MSSRTMQTNEELARAIPETVASEGEIDQLDDLLAESFVEHSPLGDEHGIEEAKAGMRRIFDAFPDVSATVEDVVTEGDTVAMRVTLRGTHEGTFMGIEPTGRSFEIPNTVFTRIEDGRIVERWVQPDMLGLLTQLGVVDAPTPTS